MAPQPTDTQRSTHGPTQRSTQSGVSQRTVTGAYPEDPDDVFNESDNEKPQYAATTRTAETLSGPPSAVAMGKRRVGFVENPEAGSSKRNLASAGYSRILTDRSGDKDQTEDTSHEPGDEDVDPQQSDDADEGFSFVGRDSRFYTPRRLSQARMSYATADTVFEHRLAEEDDKEDPVIILHHQTTLNTVGEEIDSIRSPEELMDSVNNHPVEWFSAINKAADTIRSAIKELATANGLLVSAETAYYGERERVRGIARDSKNLEKSFADMRQEYQREKQQAHEKLQDTRYQLAEAQKKIHGQEASLQKARDGIARVRAIRDDYKQRVLSLEEIIRTGVHQHPQEPQDEFDSETEMPPPRATTEGAQDSSAYFRPSPIIQPSPTINPLRPSPYLGSHSSVHHAHETKYPDIKEYDGTDDIERWIASAETKFDRSPSMFPDEWAKIEYVRDRTKGEAYHTIKNRALRGRENPYTTVQELFDDLKDAFDVYDKETEANRKLQDGSLAMKKDETMGMFLSRLNTVYAHAGLGDKAKRFQAINHLLPRYRNPASQSTNNNETWNDFQRRMKNLEQGMSMLLPREKKNETSNNKKDEKGSRNPTAPSTPSGRTNAQFSIIKKKGLCSRCLKHGHMANDDKAPCKGQKPTPFNSMPELRAAITEVSSPLSTPAAELPAPMAEKE